MKYLKMTFMVTVMFYSMWVTYLVFCNLVLFLAPESEGIPLIRDASWIIGDTLSEHFQNLFLVLGIAIALWGLFFILKNWLLKESPEVRNFLNDLV